MSFTNIQDGWARWAVLIAFSLPLASFVRNLINAQLGWPANVETLPFTLLFCGFCVALWVYGIRPDVLSPPLAFAATYFYFSPSAFAYFSGRDFFRLILVLAILFAPIYWASRTEASTKSWQSEYLPTLDGWRAIAILLVITDHLLRGIAADKHQHPPDSLLLGQQGVNIFFGISGLLITWKLVEELRQTGSISLRQFYRRRIYRIFPAAFAFLAVMGGLSVFFSLPATRLDVAATVLYFRNFVPVFWPSLCNAHFWSLSLEEQFYLFLPAALVLVRMRRFVFIAAALVILCAGWRWYFFNYLATPDLPLSIRFRTDLRVDGLLCGSLMALTLQYEAARLRLQKLLTTPVLVLLIVIFVLLMHWSGERTMLAESVTIPVLLAATFLCPRGILARVLESGPLRWVGRISYSLYLWQQFFLLCPLNHGIFKALHAFPMCLPATFVCAAVSYYCLERPLMVRAHRVAMPSGAAGSPLKPLELEMVRT